MRESRSLVIKYPQAGALRAGLDHRLADTK